MPELSRGSLEGKVEPKVIGRASPRTEVVMVLLGLAGLEVVLVNVLGSRGGGGIGLAGLGGNGILGLLGIGVLGLEDDKLGSFWGGRVLDLRGDGIILGA